VVIAEPTARPLDPYRLIEVLAKPVESHTGVLGNILAGPLLEKFLRIFLFQMARICQQLDVFHQRNLRKILGITWKDHVTNVEVLSRTGQRKLQDIVAERRLRMASHIIRMPPGWPANHAMSWTPRGSGRRKDRPTKTWRSTFKEDLLDRGVDWNSVRAVATNRSRWRTLAARCSVKDQRI